MVEQVVNYAVEQTLALLAIDSPSGYTAQAAEYAYNQLKELGFDPQYTRKGAVLVNLTPNLPRENGLLLLAHLDTLGGMITRITGEGRIHIINVGGLRPHNCEGENVRIHTREGKVYTGTFQLHNPSAHVNPNYADTPRTFETMEVVLDEEVFSKEEVEALGISNGDVVCFEPRATVTPSGYLKGRYLDDKLSVGILLALARQIAQGAVTPSRPVWLHLTGYEEVGHGGSTSVPAGITDVVAVDMGCVGDGLDGEERKVSICAKDGRSPYDYALTSELIAAAQDSGADYAVDVFTNYGSDADACLSAGYDVRHGLIGPGVFASHGYERSHKKGVLSTLKLLGTFVQK